MSVSYTDGFTLADDSKLPNKEEFDKLWRAKFPDPTSLKVPPKQ